VCARVGVCVYVIECVGVGVGVGVCMYARVSFCEVISLMLGLEPVYLQVHFWDALI